MIVLEREDIPDILLDFLDKENVTEKFITVVKQSSIEYINQLTNDNFFEECRIDDWIFSTFDWPIGEIDFCNDLNRKWERYIDSL